jgi:hypothetical protein
MSFNNPRPKIIIIPGPILLMWTRRIGVCGTFDGIQWFIFGTSHNGCILVKSYDLGVKKPDIINVLA